MTRRTTKARFPPKVREEVVLNDENWKLVEQAYGHQLPPAVREHILVSTEALSLVGAVERSAPALKKISALTIKLRDAAQSLLKEVGSPAEELAGFASFEALTEAVAIAVKEFPNDHLQFQMMVWSILTACNVMLRTWESDGGLREGAIWDAWVQSINELMQHHGLPSATRKDFRFG